MPKTEDVEIKIMDVREHLEKRKKAAEEYMRKRKEEIKKEEINIEMSQVSNEPVKKEEQKNKTFDLQEELEKKFDELFGTANNDD